MHNILPSLDLRLNIMHLVGWYALSSVHRMNNIKLIGHYFGPTETLHLNWFSFKVQWCALWVVGYFQLQFYRQAVIFVLTCLVVLCVVPCW